MKNVVLVLALVGLVLGLAGAATACHSEEFTRAKQKLNQLTLTSAQQSAILTYEQTFRKNWSATHAREGCRSHEAHAQEFIAAASGVLTDSQFEKFRGRKRTDAEKLSYKTWKASEDVRNLIKVAEAL
jgi:hypothetical protein